MFAASMTLFDAFIVACVILQPAGQKLAMQEAYTAETTRTWRQEAEAHKCKRALEVSPLTFPLSLICLFYFFYLNKISTFCLLLK